MHVSDAMLLLHISFILVSETIQTGFDTSILERWLFLETKNANYDTRKRIPINVRLFLNKVHRATQCE